MRSRQQPITNVNGDKGNETINDVEDDDENPARRLDYLDNIDAIDVNIEENFNQRPLEVQNAHSLANSRDRIENG